MAKFTWEGTTRAGDVRQGTMEAADENAVMNRLRAEQITPKRVKKARPEIAIKIGRPVYRQIAEAKPEYFASDCPMAGHHIEQGLGEDRGSSQRKHPITLMRIAYGLPD